MNRLIRNMLPKAIIAATAFGSTLPSGRALCDGKTSQVASPRIAQNSNRYLSSIRNERTQLIEDMKIDVKKAEELYSKLDSTYGKYNLLEKLALEGITQENIQTVIDIKAFHEAEGNTHPSNSTSSKDQKKDAPLSAEKLREIFQQKKKEVVAQLNKDIEEFEKVFFDVKERANDRTMGNRTEIIDMRDRLVNMTGKLDEVKGAVKNEISLDVSSAFSRMDFLLKELRDHKDKLAKAQDIQGSEDKQKKVDGCVADIQAALNVLGMKKSHPSTTGAFSKIGATPQELQQLQARFTEHANIHKKAQNPRALPPDEQQRVDELEKDIVRLCKEIYKDRESFHLNREELSKTLQKSGFSNNDEINKCLHYIESTLPEKSATGSASDSVEKNVHLTDTIKKISYKDLLSGTVPKEAIQDIAEQIRTMSNGNVSLQKTVLDSAKKILEEIAACGIELSTLVEVMKVTVQQTKECFASVEGNACVDGDKSDARIALLNEAKALSRELEDEVEKYEIQQKDKKLFLDLSDKVSKIEAMDKETLKKEGNNLLNAIIHDLRSAEERWNKAPNKDLAKDRCLKVSEARECVERRGFEIGFKQKHGNVETGRQVGDMMKKGTTGILNGKDKVYNTVDQAHPGLWGSLFTFTNAAITGGVVAIGAVAYAVLKK